MFRYFSLGTVFSFLDRFVVFLGLLVTAGVIAHFGFKLENELSLKIFHFVLGLAILYGLQEAVRFFQYREKSRYLKERWYDAVLFASFLFLIIYQNTRNASTENYLDWWIGGIGVIILLGLFSSLTGRFEKHVRKSRFALRPTQVFILSFALPILTGAALLKLPRASTFEMTWVDALFMSTSSVCVTGLSVFDLEKLTTFGQVVMLCLIQLGGLGIMTLTIAFSGLLAGGISLKDRLMISSMFSEDRLSEVKNLLLKILSFTLIIEFTGAVIMYLSIKDIGLEKTESGLIYSAIFHAVSAFCNAGFSIYKENFFNSYLIKNYQYLFTIMALIIFGGLGFPTLSNLYYFFKSRFTKTKQKVLLRTSSKIILIMTGILLLSGTILIFLFESEKSFISLNGMDRFVQSAFLSVTSRTAGFNAWPTESLSIVSMYIVIALMWIGGAPMSTAGGIKVTTLFVGLLNVRGQLDGTEKVEFLGREIHHKTISKAFAVIVLSIGFIAFSSLALIYLEPKHHPIDLVFEAVSAISTVGLSRSLTPQLSNSAKLILIALMFVGRVGLIAFLMSIYRQADSLRYKYLKEDVVIT